MVIGFSLGTIEEEITLIGKTLAGNGKEETFSSFKVTSKGAVTDKIAMLWTKALAFILRRKSISMREFTLSFAIHDHTFKCSRCAVSGHALQHCPFETSQTQMPAFSDASFPINNVDSFLAVCKASSIRTEAAENIVEREK